MALGPNLPLLDLQNSGTGRAPGSRSGATGSAGASDFGQLLSQRMQSSKPAAPAVSRPAEEISRQRNESSSRVAASESRKTERQPEPARERSRSESAASKADRRDSTAKADKTEKSHADDVERDDGVEQEGKNLPPEVTGLPLFMSLELPKVAGTSQLQSGELNGFVTWSKDNLQFPSGPQAEGMGLEELSLDGLDADSLVVTLEGEGLKLSPGLGKGELADTKLQLQTFSSVAPLTATASREPQAVMTQYSTSIQTPVHDAKWGEQMVNKVLWLTSQSIRSAEIHLNPADLGPLEVKIQVNQDQASVQIQAQNAGVREALEQSVHRLREALAGSGLGLADFDVSSQAGQQQAREQHNAQGIAGNDAASEPELEQELPDQVIETGLPGLISTYV